MRKSRRVLAVVVMLLMLVSLSGCILLPVGSSGVKASGGGLIDSLTQEEGDFASFGFNVQITQEPIESATVTEVLYAKGRFQLHDIAYGFSMNADISAVLYCADDEGEWPDKTIFFAGVADPDPKDLGDELQAVIIATDYPDGRQWVSISVQDADGAEVYANSGYQKAGNIKVKVQ